MHKKQRQAALSRLRAHARSNFRQHSMGNPMEKGDDREGNVDGDEGAKAMADDAVCV